MKTIEILDTDGYKVTLNTDKIVSVTDFNDSVRIEGEGRLGVQTRELYAEVLAKINPELPKPVKESK